MPTVDDVRHLLQIEGADGTGWLALEGRYKWREEAPPHLHDALDPKGLLWLQVKSYLVPRRTFVDFAAWARRQDWFGRWMPEGPELSQVFVGEWPLHPSAGVYADELRSIERRTDDADPAPSDVVPTWATYAAVEDDSLSGGVHRSIPANRLIGRQGLRWRAGSLKFDLPNGQVAALDPSAHHRGSSALLHDEALLRGLLDDEEMSLVWTVLGEKNVSDDHRADRILVMSGVATLESGTAGIEVDMRTRLHS